jgi:hypothetical protein
MLIRLDVALFAILLLPLVFAGMASSGIYYHPPKTWTGMLGVLTLIGVPLYFAGIIVHYKLFKEKGRDRNGYSRAFPIVLIVLGYALGVFLGSLVFH